MENITKKSATKELGSASSEHPIADVLLGNDPPMEKAYPGLAPALVFLAYPLAIIVMVAFVSLYFLSAQKDGRQSDVVTPATLSPSDESTLK